MDSSSRRVFVGGATLSGALLVLGGCSRSSSNGGSSEQGPAASSSARTGGSAAIATKDEKPKGKEGEGKKEDEEDEVGAVEDLMREHGVIRRALVVYREAAVRLRKHPALAVDVPPDAIQKAAKLFRTFGEDYHERKLEEAFIFPAVKRAGGPAAALADVLTAQHERGREITNYLLSSTQQGSKIGANADALANALESLARMYESHSAREDTILFPAWKKTMSKKQLEELGEKFESIEHAQFGKDGFDEGVEQIAMIEVMLGLQDLALFTAPAPNKGG